MKDRVAHRSPFSPRSRWGIPLVAFAVLMLWGSCLFPQEAQVHNIVLWEEGKPDGGWTGPHEAEVAKNPAGVILKAKPGAVYGSYFRSIGEVDLDQLPYFAVETDQSDGAFSCKLINMTKNDKQVIFKPTRTDGVLLTHIPGQTGWSGKVPLSLGIYCQGGGKSLRLKMIQFCAKPDPKWAAKFSQVRNLLFDSSFEADKAGEAPMQSWHRLGGYVPAETPWRVVSGGAYDGENCLRTEKPGLFFMQREVHERGTGKYTFAVYLKAARAGHRARLRVVTYRQGKPFATDAEEKEVSVRTGWERYLMTVDVPSVRGRSVLGALDLGVESLDEGELLADAFQFELGERPTLFGRNDALIAYKPATDLRSPLYPPIQDPPPPGKMPREEAGKVGMKLLAPPDKVRPGRPMCGTVVLPQGKSYDVGRWALKSPGGDPLPSQAGVISRWKEDGSIKAAWLVSEADGAKEYALEYGASQPATPATGAPTIEELQGKVRVATPALAFTVDTERFRGPELGEAAGESGFQVTSFDGVRFSSALGKVASFAIEERGPVRVTLRVEGDLRSEKGQHLLSYVARIHAFRTQPLLRIEYTWINTNASPTVAVSSIAWRLGLGAVRSASFVGPDGGRLEADLAAGPASLTQLNEKRKYFYEITSAGKTTKGEGKARGDAVLQLANETVALHVEDFWQNHPLAISADKGSLTVHFWPATTKAVELTRGMSKTYLTDLWFGKGDAPSGEDLGPLVLISDPNALCGSGVFGGQVLPSEGSPFPLFEKVAVSTPALGHMSPEYLDGNDTYGQFNFGDTLGDGGWSNMETQADHAMWVHFIRTGNPVFFRIAQAASRHYRDVDVDQLSGGTYVHNPSHTLSGESTSHAWIQGTLDHYVVTGERRSIEVALLHKSFLKGMPLEELSSGGREVTRVLDNLADLYMVTGDEDLIRKHDDLCAYQRKNLVGKSAFPGLFQHLAKGEWTYPANFVPWYGLYSLVKLRLATGDRRWQDFLLEETSHAMSVQPFKYARPEYFEENPLTDDERIVRCLAEGAIGDRGCMLFPALGYAYRWGKSPRYLDIGMSAVYIAMISGEYRDPLYGLAGVFLEQARQSGLGEPDEKRYFEKAIDIMQRSAHPSLANSGFEEGTKYWAAWRVKATTSYYWVPVRKACLLMDSTVKKEGKQSLHVVLTRENPPMGFGVPLDSDHFVLEAGKTYHLEGWIRNAGDVKASVSLRVRPLSLDSEPSTCETKYLDPDPDGWQRWTIEAKIAGPSLGQLAISVARKAVTAEGEAWADGIIVK